MASYRMYMAISYDCCNSVAYGTRSKIENTVTGEIYDYSDKKKDAVYSRTFLCSNAPASWQDPAVLWNEVAKVEKAADARQARTFVANLPAELADKPEELYKIVDELGDSFAEEGMCCTITVHKPDEENPNWHIHAQNTLRKVDKDGKFEPKSRKVYEYEKDEFGEFRLDKDGKKIKMLKRDKNGEPKRDKGGHVIYVCRKENLDNGWGTNAKLKEWRQRWADIENRALERNGIDERVSCESYLKQGIILPPLPRLSAKDWQLKEQGEENEAIKEWNKAQEERKLIRETYPELFDKKGKQIISLDTAISALEAQKAEIEKEIEEAREKIKTPEETAKTAKMAYDLFGVGEKPTENAKISEEIKKDDIVVVQETKPAEKQPEIEQKKKVRKVYQIASLMPDENEPNTYWVMQTFVNTTEEYKPGQKEERNGNIDYFFETKEQREKKLQELSKEHKLLYQSYKADTREPDLLDIAALPHRNDEEIIGCDSWERVMEYSAQALADGRKMTVEEAQEKGEKDADNWFRANIGYSNSIEDKITNYTDTVYKAQMKYLQDTNKQKYSKKQLAKVQYFDKNLEDVVEKDENTCRMWLDKLARDITERYVKPLEKAYNRAKQVIEDKRNEFVEPEKTFELHSTAEHRQAIKEYKIAFVEKIKDMFASTMRFVRESVNYRDNKDRRQERALYLMEANKPDNFRLHMENKDRQQQKKAEEQAYYKAIQKKFEKEHPKQKKDFGIC